MNSRKCLFYRPAILLILTLALILPSSVSAETLRRQLNDMFQSVIDINLAGPGSHGSHFTVDNVESNGLIIDVLQNYIAVNAATYPLTSSAAAITYDFSTGVPIASLESAGPIYAHRFETIGKKRLSVGFNFTAYDLETIRGLNTDDITVSFLHEDVNDNGTGDLVMEQDYIDLHLRTDIDASILAFYATYGLSDRLDVGIAIPVVTVSMVLDPTAVMNSSSAVVFGSPLHFWGGDGDTSFVWSPGIFEERSTGVGDIAFRAKYNFLDRGDRGLSAYFELRMPTGDEDNFLGTGNTSLRALLVGSASYGTFTPHFNLGFDLRSGDFERDEFELTLGYDFKATDKLTLVADWIGEFELGSAVEELQFPEATRLIPTSDNSVPYSRSVSPSNIPNARNDNITNVGFGAKWALSEKLVISGSVLFPTNDNGLRGNFVPTFGLDLSL
ncbi:hypothetical protein GF377_09650 [candidate division GN15 bacterium]|nr:hypothetical protein [candidate division GN15 bacterium]